MTAWQAMNCECHLHPSRRIAQAWAGAIFTVELPIKQSGRLAKLDTRQTEKAFEFRDLASGDRALTKVLFYK